MGSGTNEKDSEETEKNGGDDGARTRDLRRDRPNVSETSGLYLFGFKRLVESA